MPVGAPSPAPRRRSVFASRLVSTHAEGTPPRVIDDMRRAILSGEEPPGTLIPIDEVARFFGVSPIPVREALKVLLGEGLVEHTPRVGYAVAKLTFAEFRELYDVRAALESAALRAAVGNAGPADDERVLTAHEGLARALAAGDERAYHEQSRLFHDALIAPAGMRRLVHMYRSAWNITEPARPMARVEHDGRHAFYDDHDRMLAAFVARDADTLVAESQAHYRHLTDALEGFADDLDVFLPG
ncbi:GntR family transcriptional regulator [Nocardioides bruguierae]|uniref:GntR family transcriptional regulator n=1 Tax=Nocardioides bruguierae TaxID=2945102 RepID=A0A9X2DC42_9ACTN|nr:GntR family transcriptional regulator [Nocardioides bruguierae]MCM0622652.1 GntR family transcriptional regulator [Nocardioides bruguierae]